MDLTGWTYLFEFGYGLYIYAKGKDRVGVGRDGKAIIQYRMNATSRNNPRCKECLANRACNDAT